MSLFAELQKRREEILKLAAECGLKDVRVFGSVAREEEDEESDVDILANAVEIGDPLAFVDFQEAVEKMTGRKVDIVFEAGLFRGLREIVIREAKPL